MLCYATHRFQIWRHLCQIRKRICSADKMERTDCQSLRSPLCEAFDAPPHIANRAREDEKSNKAYKKSPVNSIDIHPPYASNKEKGG